MSTAAYYDQKLKAEQVKATLTRLGAKHLPARSPEGIKVYSLASGGEAMVERAGDLLRLRLFRGKCAC